MIFDTPKKSPSEVEFCLLSLLVTERAGRELAKAYERVGGKPISYGTLYVVLGRMRDAGWISVKPDPNGDGRTRLFKIKGAGALVLNNKRDEFAKLAGLPRAVKP